MFLLKRKKITTLYIQLGMELIELGKVNNLKLEEISGVNLDILKNEWIFSKDDSVNYLTKFKKI